MLPVTSLPSNGTGRGSMDTLLANIHHEISALDTRIAASAKAYHDNLAKMLNEIIQGQNIIEQKLDKYIKQESSWEPVAVRNVPKSYE